MRALPMWQPWASLVALGAKKVETRAYPPWKIGLGVGERIAIHATKTDRELRFCSEPYFHDHVPEPAALPLGAIIATCIIDRWTRITAELAAELARINPQEHAFGDYTPGRFAWVLRDLVRPPVPVEWRGSQGSFEVPDGVLSAPAQGTLL